MTNWILYLTTVTVVVFSPGPMTIFALANSASYGRRIAVVGILGGSVAYVGHLCIAYVSLSTMSSFSPEGLKVIRVAGGAYFLWLAYKQFRLPTFSRVAGRGGGATTPAKTWLKGFLIAASNPKAILFFAALLPQFITPGSQFTTQFAGLAVAYLVVQFLSNLAYSYFGTGLFRWLDKAKLDHIAPKIIAMFLAAVGIFMII